MNNTVIVSSFPYTFNTTEALKKYILKFNCQQIWLLLADTPYYGKTIGIYNEFGTQIRLISCFGDKDLENLRYGIEIDLPNIQFPKLGQIYTPEYLVKIMIDNIIISPKTIIDPFCGQGAILREAKKRYPNIKIIGYDLDNINIQLCKSIWKDGIFENKDTSNPYSIKLNI